MTQSIYVGQDVKVRFTAQTDDGQPAEPASVRFKIKAPGAGPVTHEYGSSNAVAEEAAGEVYAFTFDTPRAGRYVVRAEALNGLGEVVATSELTVLVTASGVE